MGFWGFGVLGDETGAFKPHRPISKKLKPKVLESDCKLFDGRIVLRQRTLEGGVCEPAYGRIRYLGNHCGPKPFECRYSDGTKERLSYHIIQDCVLPESTPTAGLNVPPVVTPPERRHTTRTVTVTSAAYISLPSKFSLYSLYNEKGTRIALQLLMPGEWSTSAVAKIHRQCQGGMSLNQILDPKSGGALKDEANLLTRAVTLNLVGSILDPCCGAGVLVQEFRRLGLPITCNSLS